MIYFSLKICQIKLLVKYASTQLNFSFHITDEVVRTYVLFVKILTLKTDKMNKQSKIMYKR